MAEPSLGVCEQEEHYGRARVHTQWGDAEEDILEAVQMCPVDCISFVRREQLALLEFVLKSCAREDTALMARRCGPQHRAHPCWCMLCSKSGTEQLMHCSTLPSTAGHPSGSIWRTCVD